MVPRRIKNEGSLWNWKKKEVTWFRPGFGVKVNPRKEGTPPAREVGILIRNIGRRIRRIEVGFPKPWWLVEPQPRTQVWFENATTRGSPEWG